jgi:acyl-CoA thioester hydrolase
MTDANDHRDEVRRLLAGYAVIVEQVVVWGEMDAYRHVNNVVYFRYFENARLEYFRRVGWPAVEERTGVGPILASTAARFRKALTYPDTISIGTRASHLGTDRFALEYLIVSHEQRAVVTEGHGLVVAFHYRDGRKVALPDEVRQAILALEGGRLTAPPGSGSAGGSPGPA